MLRLLVILSVSVAVSSDYNTNYKLYNNYHNYYNLYPNYLNRNPFYQPNYYNYANVGQNVFQIAQVGVCQKFCYEVNYFGQVGWKCCDFKEKEGSCPANCLVSNRKLSLMNIHCNSDCECPPDFKCCVDNCYKWSRICKRSVVSNNCPSTAAVTSPIVTEQTTSLDLMTEELTRATEATTISEPTTHESTTKESTIQEMTTRKLTTTTEDEFDYGSSSGSGSGDDEFDNPAYEDYPGEIPLKSISEEEKNNFPGSKGDIRKQVEVIPREELKSSSALDGQDEFDFVSY